MVFKSGSDGDYVRKIQLKLGLSADGTFGALTKARVMDWQSNNDLPANGIVDGKMWIKLFGTDINQNNQALIADLKFHNLNGKIPSDVLLQIPDTAMKFSILSNLRLAHFLTQCSHESGGFMYLTENLNYSAEGLKKIFSKYFPDDLAQAYARKPEKIGSRVYANRMGNGNEASGDGYKYRGRGYIQLTGKDNYARFSDFIGEDVVANPDLVATKFPLASAAFYFASNKLWDKCDLGADETTVTEVTKAVNGGTNGLADRLKHFDEYYAVLG